MTGASRKAIRYYESSGLIPIPPRQGKYRIYSDLDVFLIHMIKYAQTAGFSLAELKKLTTEKTNKNQFPIQLANILFEQKQAALQAEINSLKNLEQHLVDMKDKMNHIFGSSSSS